MEPSTLKELRVTRRNALFTEEDTGYGVLSMKSRSDI